ncbi:hypothetical protein [Streptomyces fungicidicus]|uniref:Uncharacterized protein n=1 Tax=Streptomyces fungicidicus TaxID=68203 RepID=A0A494UMP9_9ACTN|nr:hypothetical protein [Streptomyces fungicidicus]AYL36582.1 hypothetical protein CNQ36_14780 [Streptomyces fungicidicus]
MQPDDEMTDALAEKIFSGTVGGVLNTPLTWKQKNMPKRAHKPVHVEAWAPLKTDLSCRLELRMRIGLDVLWEYTLMVLHPSDRTCLKRLDIRGTHLDRETGEGYLNRTHKHKWSKARGNKDVYAPNDIRHNPDPILGATLESMDEEYDRVVRDFIAECKMTIGGAYAWVPPAVPLTQPTFDGLEDYP